MTIEAMALLPWYEDLFTRQELSNARRRLEEHKFDIDAYLATAWSNPPGWWGEVQANQ